MKDEHIIIYGKHATLSAISNQDRFIKNIILTKGNDKLINEIVAILKQRKNKIPIERVDRKVIDNLTGKNVKHQGIIILANKLKKKSFENVFYKMNYRVGVVLDKITDPNNVGSIYRSALCFDLDFIVNSERGSSKETGALLNSACGAFDKINTFYADNLVATIREFKKNNWWVLGTDISANIYINNFFSNYGDITKLLIVLGSEGGGVRRLTKEHCDFLVKIPMKKSNSLNVSNAAAIFFYEINKHLKLN